MSEPEPTSASARGYRYVFCVGMRRGGSTLQMQLVSALLEPDHVHLATPDTIDELIGGVSRHHNVPMVIKSHQFLPAAARLSGADDAKIVYVYRDLRDVVASIVTKYDMPPFSFVHGGLASLLKEYQQWSSVPKIYVTRYESMIHDIAAEAIRLAQFLDIELSTEQAKELAERFGVDRQRESIRNATNVTLVGAGANKFDATTLLHHDHIQFGGSGAYRKILSPRLIAALEWQLRSWMRQNGYARDYSIISQFSSHIMFGLKALGHRVKMVFVGRNHIKQRSKQES